MFYSCTHTNTHYVPASYEYLLDLGYLIRQVQRYPKVDEIRQGVKNVLAFSTNGVRKHACMKIEAQPIQAEICSCICVQSLLVVQTKWVWWRSRVDRIMQNLHCR